MADFFTARHREMDLRTGTSGTYYWKTTGVTKTSTALVGTKKVCDDIASGLGRDNYFNLIERNYWTPVLDGAELGTGGVILKQFKGYPIGYRPAPPNACGIWPVPTIGELEAICQAVAAETQPNASSVSMPSEIGELHDLPLLVKGWGNSLLKAVAKGYITWRFAVKPMISSLQKMSQFNKAVLDRFRYLERLKDKKWVSRRVFLGRSLHTTPPVRRTVHSEGCTITADQRISYLMKEWATIRWKLRVTLPADVMARYYLAERLIKGITCYEALNTMWQLTPWSWLVDWFGNVSQFLAANQNTIPCIPSGFCYMRTVSARTEYSNVTKPSWVSLSGEHFEREQLKLRLVPAVEPQGLLVPTMPILTGGQWAILGSLAVLRWR